MSMRVTGSSSASRMAFDASLAEDLSSCVIEIRLFESVANLNSAPGLS